MSTENLNFPDSVRYFVLYTSLLLLFVRRSVKFNQMECQSTKLTLYLRICLILYKRSKGSKRLVRKNVDLFDPFQPKRTFKM